jgi:hypothetical protein
MSEPCVGCGHEVVAWDPHDSATTDDLICYYCGLHADSKAADRIRELELQEKELTESRDFWKDKYYEVEAIARQINIVSRGVDKRCADELEALLKKEIGDE